jgi:transcription termination/antitermination protein NusG
MELKSTPWKVIYVASRQEKKVAHLLEKSGIEYYLPLIKKMREWSDRKKMVEMPLFNGYLFVRPSALERDQLLTIPGVVKFLRYNGQDGSVSENEIEIIRTLIAKGYDISEVANDDVFESGDKVKIVSGPMKNFEGEILSHSGAKYAFLQLQNIGHSLKIKLPKEVLKKVDKILE